MSRIARAAGVVSIGLAIIAGIGGAFEVDTANAHPLAPSLLELRQTADGRFTVRWKTSSSRPTGSRSAPQLPDWCKQVGEETVQDAPGSIDRRFVIDCGERGLTAATLGVTDLDTSGTLALLRVELADGRLFRTLLDGTNPSMQVPERQGPLDVARGYVKLGVEHLLTGFDHLLFLLCLCLLVRTPRTLLWTLCAFTAGHSMTLTLTTLGPLRCPPPVADLAIALSVVLVAAELLRDETVKRTTWMRRRPWSMAFAFGLLHGLGFAGALNEAGLPAGEIPLALLSFNIGIELGQLAFVAAVLLLARLAAPLLAMLPPRSIRVPAYAIGSLAAFWFWSRATLLLGQLFPS